MPASEKPQRKPQAPRYRERKDRARGKVLTSPVDYTDDELEFLKAIEAFKKSSGRQFPTWSEVLTVLRGLGYTKAAG